MRAHDNSNADMADSAIAIVLREPTAAGPMPSNVADDRQKPLLSPPQMSPAVDGELTWIKRLAVAIGVSGPETIQCPVCLDSVPVAESVTLSACGHTYCRPCLTMFLELSVRDGQVYPKCFYEVEGDATSAERNESKPCSTLIEPSDIDKLVSEEMRNKYHTFRFNRENEFGRQCPHCGHSQVCDGPKNPACVCINCGKSYCFLHANAHGESSCERYERQQLRHDRATRTTIARISKQCPTCNVKIEKDGGCNHVKCVRCQTNFCWMCGKVVDDSDLPNHFQWWNLGGCAGLMRAEIHQDTLWQRVVAKVLSVLNFFLIGPASFVLAVVLTVATCGCLPCVCWADMSFGMAFLLGMDLCGWILLLPLTLLGWIYEKCKAWFEREKPKPEHRAEIDPADAA